MMTSDRQSSTASALLDYHEIVMVASVLASPASLDLPLNFRMDDTHVTSQGVVPRKGLLLVTILAPDLDLLTVVDRVLVSGEVVGS